MADPPAIRLAPVPDLTSAAVRRLAPDPTPAPRGAAAMADPARDIRVGAIVAALFFVGFLGWAATARLDAAAYASGVLVVSGQRQSVQHRDGGVVRQILVHEGDRVARGQLLISLAAADVLAQERALTGETIRLLAQRARLEAEQLGVSRIAAPAEFAQLAPEDRGPAALALRLQQAELDARRDTLAAQRLALVRRAAQSGAQGRGLGDQATSAREQLRLIDQELEALRPVAERGFVPQTRIRELQRERAELVGQQGQYNAGVAQSEEAAQESRVNSLEAERTFRERTAADLRDVDTRLGDALPKLAAARDQLARTEIRAPATGTVVGLSVFTPGGVIAPGQKLMDIVPAAAPLRIQVRIPPDDADELRVGQEARVKFPGLHDRTLPDLPGRLTRLSADSLTDERTGQSYFTGEVVVPDAELARLRAAGARAHTLRAGMPAQVLVPLRRRTALDYALEPLVGAFWSSFRER